MTTGVSYGRVVDPAVDPGPDQPGRCVHSEFHCRVPGEHSSGADWRALRPCYR